ncbi:MAG: hypothetical protein RL693_1329 [Verrucomicrobiota bacterium]
MSSSPEINHPRLDAPGAGLPKAELFFARRIFRLGRWRSSPEKALANFVQQREEILKLVSRCDASTGAQRVLIRRLPGLEDSSRYWSVFMTLDHLRIVNESVANVIKDLCAGHVPPGTASTATVKPDPTVDQTVIAAFETSCDLFEQLELPSSSLSLAKTYAHPWFGPLDAVSWHFMAGFHMKLHRKQIEAILAGM